MTVNELLQQIMTAYAGATPEALSTFVPVFHKRLKHREGKHLQEGADEVFATFKAKYGQPFPIPADFEKHMPNTIFAKDDSKGGPPIQDYLEERANRKHVNIQRWMEGQGAKIRETRPENHYTVCLLMALEHCHRASWRHLTVNQIAECERRALSQERLRQFGSLPKTNEIWWQQIGEVAAKLGFSPPVWETWNAKRKHIS